MIKDFFGWLIAVSRIWAFGSTYENKTNRAIYGLSMTLSFYIIGLVVNSAFYFEPNVPRLILSDGLVGGGLVLSFILPLLILKRIFTKEVTEFYVQKYSAENNKPDYRQHFLAFLFNFAGWFTLAGPFFIFSN
jgi:hypothetical protein